VGALVVVDPGVKVKSIERDAAVADRNVGDERAHLDVEAVAVHAEVGGCVPEPDEAGKHAHRATPRGSPRPHACDRKVSEQVGLALDIRALSIVTRRRAARLAVGLPRAVEVRALEHPARPARGGCRQSRPDVLLEGSALEAEVRHRLGIGVAALDHSRARTGTLVRTAHHR
jgi:hypothetical protein